MNQKITEQRALKVNVMINIVMAISAFWAYASTSIQAIFLDAGFSLIVALSSVMAIFISRYSNKRSKVFPNGQYMYEPLYAMFKSLVTLILLMISTISSIQLLTTFLRTGTASKINIVPVIPYILLMIALSFGLSFYAKYQNKKINQASTILAADSKMAFVDGLMAAGVGLGVLLFLFIDENGPFSFLLYTGDSLITLILVLFALKRPLLLLKESFIELVGGVTTDIKIIKEIEQTLHRNLPEDTQLKNCQIRKTGMSYHISVNLTCSSETIKLSEFRKSKVQIEDELSAKYTNLNVSFVF
ncbi:cation transporter [Paenibacillus sp. Marseille-Q9583]